MLSVATKSRDRFNCEYLEQQNTLDNIQSELRKQVELLDLESTDKADALCYIQDRVTLFRFLKDSEFIQETTISRLVDTIKWRAENRIHRITYNSIASEFFDKDFAFYHKRDLIGRPLAIIQMRNFPKFKDKTKSLSDFMQPFACFVMEVARQWTLDLTRENEKNNVQPALVSQISIVIDIANAPFVPADSSLMQALKLIVNQRFPGFVGSVYIMNFGWMYQGIWQVVKLVLSEQAKARVSFINSHEVKQVISDGSLLKALGGNDDFVWSLEADTILQTYATDKRFMKQDNEKEIAHATRLSRSASISSIISDDSSIFFDAPDYLTPRLLSPPIADKNDYHYELLDNDYTSGNPSLYGTPGTLTPLGVYRPPSQALVRTSQPRYFLNGFHMGDSFLTSFFTTQRSNHDPTILNSIELVNRLAELVDVDDIEKDDEDMISDDLLAFNQRRGSAHFPHMLPLDHPHSIYISSPRKHQLARIEQRILRITRRLFHLSFAYKGAIYWLMLYIFLRGPVETTLKRQLQKVMVSPQQIAYTTIGVTATVAAAMSASFTSSLEANRRQSHM